MILKLVQLSNGDLIIFRSMPIAATNSELMAGCPNLGHATLLIVDFRSKTNSEFYFSRIVGVQFTFIQKRISIQYIMSVT